MQTRLQSFTESTVNTVLGFTGSLVITLIVFTLVPGPLLLQSAVNTGACTVWSLVRGYGVRRYFARRHSS